MATAESFCALVWIQLTSLAGMCAKICEATFGIKYIIKVKDEAFADGSTDFIKKGLGQVWLVWLFTFFSAIYAFGIRYMA